MGEYLIVAAIVAGAVGYTARRYFFAKTGACSCGCAGCAAAGKKPNSCRSR